ncbi:plasmid pRiA4b ORF-3 family protein [Synechocystis salina]|uniref:Plasmid pRiA4b ORF-3 family protein n=1 Tax=Synechocystis salina LEGE 00031 TaxID=1828736 RepID=A0ABR9VXC3_9SYNC|nr:plasmid pRiA4b ORF-3 family protein [Synechocystis salina]MBE9241652.1 plasmid pRiA4b ORF-3 family protein [Synechocystis salina LEGE 00041]MBE9255528.1 plasmid pRiA4b ORF-3 family protein [Synechocystis salina LEGE 00031]
MAGKKQGADATVYQLKISLLGAKPPIWRRVQVPSDTTLNKLHNIIQDSMGWFNYHLHSFFVDGQEYGPIDPYIDETDYEDESKVKLSGLNLAEKYKFRYVYDFGDDWYHEILVEKILPRQEDQHYPFCLKAVRACPPEDCGGIWGYEELLEILQDPQHPEREDRLEWLGGNFDPQEVSLKRINECLREC